MHRIRLLSLCLTLFAVDVSAAELYRCTADDGSTIYSQRPCATDAEAVDLEGNISEFGGASGSMVRMNDGQRTQIVELKHAEVKIGGNYLRSDEGLYVPFQGTDRLVPFDDLISVTVGRHPGLPCGNTGHLCDVDATVVTREGSFSVHYEVLRNITVSIEDVLTGRETDLTIWFGDHSETNIRQISLEN